MDKFLKAVAEKWENESEYAGRMETWCFWCGKYQEPRQPEAHEDDCIHLEAWKIYAEQMEADYADLKATQEDARQVGLQ